MTKQILAVALAAPLAATATEETLAMNPIRKVVNLLQTMNKKIEAEGDRADELHKKYMCYCENSEGDLQASITAAQNKIPELGASIKASTSQKTQLESDLKQHQVDRSAAKKSMAEATSLRQKEKATYDKALA